MPLRHGSSASKNMAITSLTESNANLEAELDMALVRIRHMESRRPEGGRYPGVVMESRWSYPDMVLIRCNSTFGELISAHGAVLEGSLRFQQWAAAPRPELLQGALQFLEEEDGATVTMRTVISDGAGAGRLASSLVCRPISHGDHSVFKMVTYLDEPLYRTPAPPRDSQSVKTRLRNVHPVVEAAAVGPGEASLDIPDELLHEQLLAFGDRLLPS